MYFNGTHPNAGFLDAQGKPRKHKPLTHMYCDVCAEARIPLPAAGPVAINPRIGRHWDTGFTWAPYFGGDATCSKCGRPV